MKKEIKEEARQEMFKFLNSLRRSRVIDMFGAGSYLRVQFNLSKREARFILQEWMQNFGNLKKLK
tara:strand:+ start:2170 stop:2364 length:195 start_codon:yes stop_codon:yes gene_type:complete